jgi:glutaredoxin
MKTRILFLNLSALFLIISFFAFIPPASSQIYKWTDESGNVRFSDSPRAGVKVQKVQGDSGGSKTEASPAAPGGPPKAEKRESRKVKVIMYMTDWCPYCRKAREYLQSLDVDLVEYNVEKNREKAAEFKAKGGSGVPLIDVEGTVIKGYNQDSLKSAVDDRRNR